MSPTSNDAKRLTNLGLKAHWLAPPVSGQNASGKRPLESSWQVQGYKSDIGEPPRSGCNLGLQTGRVEGTAFHVIVVDLDSEAALQWAQTALPYTPMKTLTSKGEHWFYRYPENTDKVPNKCRFTTSDGTKLEIDIRGDGGNVVVAPSAHPSGHVYSEITPWDQLRPESLPVYALSWLDGRKISASMGRPKPEVPESPEVEALFADLPTEPPPDSERPGLLPEQFQTRLYNNCKRRLGGDTAIAALKAIALGQNYAPSGERNATLFQAVRLLAEWFPDVPDGKLEEWLRGSLLTTGDKPDHEELHNFHDVLRRSREKFAQRDHLLIRMHKASIVPTRALIETGLNLARYLILGFPNGYHLAMQSDGRYGVALRRRTELLPSIDHDNILGWAVRGGIARFEYVDNKGKTKKLDWDSIARQYVWPINQARGSFALDISKVEGDTFYEAVAPRREDLKPLRSTEVDQWLQLLGGSSSGLLLDWLATFTDLAHPTAALFLIGAAGAGKNLLADGLARYWLSNKPVPFEVTLRDFNEDLEKSPFIFADEKLPIDPKGRIELDTHLRALVTATHQTLYRKHQKAMQVDGCLRILAATNQHNFTFKGMDTESKRALAERILLIEPQSDAADYLRSLGGRPVLESWVAGDALIRHVLWLAENRAVQPGSRLLVPGNGLGLINRAQNRDGVSADLCTWLCNYLLDSKPPPGAARVAVLIEDGKLLVSSVLLHKVGAEGWLHYVSHGRAVLPPQQYLTNAIASLSIGDSQQRKVPGTERWISSGRPSYHAIDLPQLVATAKQAGHDFAAIEARVLGSGITFDPSPTPAPVIAPVPTPVPQAAMTRRSLSELLGAAAPEPKITHIMALPGLLDKAEAIVRYHMEQETTDVPEHSQTSANEVRPEKKRAKAAPKAKPQKPKEERTADYFTPESCPWAEALQNRCPETEENSVKFFAPKLQTAMAGHPSAYARTTAAYRAHRAAIRAGLSPVECAGRALSTWYDGGARPWFSEVSLVAQAS